MIDKPDLTPPKAPESTGATVLKSTLTHALSGAVAFAIASKIPGLKKFFDRGIPAEAIEGAAYGSAIGFVTGFVESQGKNEKYGVELENHALKHKVVELQNDKSFAVKVAQEKLQEPQTEPKR
jgi:hypothetical protein